MSDNANQDQKERIDVDVPDLPVQVHAHYVKDFSFENPNAPESLRAINVRPQMDVNLMMDASRIEDPENPNLYESSISLTVKATHEGKVLFIAEIVYAALVTLKDIPADRINPILFIDVPSLTFPFARQMMANATAAGGFPPFMMNPVDFRTMFLSQQKNRASQQPTHQTAGNA